ncbi:MAG: 16S rRNA (cytosine(1402)-N(4))-methyltransferase RsmH [Actinobacteria bacterium]|nr:16S rRNA (cytosine(1402)-N(4))-methyltransferase RsmH [Actinomycetota bacterium]
MTRYEHQAAMTEEVVELLRAVPAGWIVDATVGGGGHARALLEDRPDIRVLGMDRDPEAVTAATAALAEFGERVRVVHGNFSQLAAIASEASEGVIMGILFDLGVSSPQLDWPERGFSYWGDAPLDMRMDSAGELTAEKVLNEYDEEALVDVLQRYGEEKFAKRIAAQIVARRPLETTGDLVAAVKDAIPARARRRGPHPARRTFQAIRMEVNRELPNLEAGLDESVHLLAPGGRILVLSYHSLEDRLVKDRFTQWTGVSEQPPGLPVEPVRKPLVRVLTRRPMRPRPAEIATNRRAQSARLRAAEKVRASSPS